MNKNNRTPPAISTANKCNIDNPLFEIKIIKIFKVNYIL